VKSAYVEDRTKVPALPSDFYSSKNYADKAIDYIRESQKEEKPFFHYLSFTAPHWPLQVPDEFIDLYKGDYDDGYQALAATRLSAAKRLNIIPQSVDMPTLLPNIIPWHELSKSEQENDSRSMEIYAAMVERLDYHVGRVITFLKETDAYDNTMIIFLSDNGAEGNSIMGYINTGEWVAEMFDNSLANMGKLNSYVELGTGWARASTTPFKWYKAFTSEGGLRVPAIFKLPTASIRKDQFVSEIATIKDIAPTCLSIADVEHPGNIYFDKKVFSMTGVSMIPFLKNQKEFIHHPDAIVAYELFGRQSIRKGKWKAEWLEKPYGTAQWELYNLENDLGQQTNLAESEPDILRELMVDWDTYIEQNEITLPDRPTAYATEKVWREASMK